MSGTIDFNYEEGNKGVKLVLSGFQEENSIILVREVLKVIQNQEEPKKEIEPVAKTVYNQGLKLVEQAIDVPESPEDEFIEDDLTPPEEYPQEENEHLEFNPDNETYQAYYICKCGDKGKHRIKRSQIYVNCWDCGKRMRVRDANIHGFPHKDDYGNTFIAGEFRRHDEIKYGAMI